VPSDLDPASLAELARLRAGLAQARPTNIGFPGATDFDYAGLAEFFAGHLLNNVGDPFIVGAGGNHTKDFEREVVGWVADLFRAPPNGWWGYVTTGSTEGTLYALHLARERYPDALVYASGAAHYSVHKSVRLLAMESITVRADHTGRIDYEDLSAQVAQHRHRPAIVVATAGTTMTEAVDDVRWITQILDSAEVHRRFIHVDAALAGVPLALLPVDRRPGFDFGDGADAIVVSGHKFFGCPIPSGVVVVRAGLRGKVPQAVEYIGSPDTTITGSRSGHAPLVLWYAVRRHGVEGMRRRADASRELATYTQRRLLEVGWDAHRNAHAFTVVLRTPPPPVTDRWVLASADGWSHIVCMPGVTREQIDAFVADLVEATPGITSSPLRSQPGSPNGRRLPRRRVRIRGLGPPARDLGPGQRR
jgi:histidine decarboxylase